jgi:pimeloyl-ACP methyl ester carboxylesterase
MSRRYPRVSAPPMPAWLERLVPFERYRVDTGAWRMHVMEAGAGLPVVMVHGNPTWGFLWRHVARALTGEHRVILPDLIGLGFSDKPRRHCQHTLENHATWLRATLDHLALERYVLAVQDWGGPIGVLAASRRPEQLAGLVVLNTVLGPPRDGFRPTAFHRFAQMPVVSDIAFRLGGFPQVALGRAQGDPRSIEGEVARAYRWPLRSVRDNRAPLALARMVPDGPAHPSIPALREVADFVESWRGPSAIVWGDRDPVLGRAFGRVQRALPEARVWRTPAGHFLQEEVPEVIADAIRHVAARAAG